MTIAVRVPATSANLGPGFDVLGLALGLHNDLLYEEAEGVRVTIEGEGTGRLATGADNVVARGARMVYEMAGRPFPGAVIHCVNRIPPARGLGSSAAAWVAGLLAANAVLGSPLQRDDLLAMASRAEGHPDNVAAALLGGLTVSCVAGERVSAVSLPVSEAIGWVVLIPEMESSTREARKVLAATVPRADAVFNLQRLGLLLASLGSGRVDLLGVAMDDRLHQPQRQALFPWMESVRRAAIEAGAVGCVLSGAGPSLLASIRSGSDDSVARAMERALREVGVRGRALPLAVDTVGATWNRRP
jgi:homoserine kinase